MSVADLLSDIVHQNPSRREWQLRDLLCDRMCTCGHVIKGLKTIPAHISTCNYRQAMLELGYVL
jgi:hypothetical protein